MLIHEVVSRGGRLHPQRTAFKHVRGEVTYGELDALTNNLARQIQEHGLGGAHGGIYADNSIEYAVGYFSIAKAGGVIVPTTTALPHVRLPSELAFADVEYVVTDAKHADEIREVAGQVESIKAVVVLSDCGRTVQFEGIPLRLAGRRLNGVAPGTENDPAVMFATSGTASEPKRVMLTHRNMLSNVSSFLAFAGLYPRDRALIVLPMTAVGTNTTEMLAYLASGLTIRIYSGVFVLGEFCRVLEEDRISVLNVTPFILNMMLWKSAEMAKHVKFLKRMFFASAPMPPAQFTQLIEHFPTVQFLYGYGLTEASPRCTTLAATDQQSKMGSSGRVLRNVEVRIVDDFGQPLPVGEMGEVAVRGPNVMLGYYKRPDLTEKVLRDGWLFTGDSGYLDADGFLYVKGRKKNIIISRGICVNPEEVEQEIMGSPGVHEVFVAGRNDDRVGEQIVAYVVPREGVQLSEDLLKSFLRERLDPVKIPSRIEFVSHLKRNYNQKLIRA